MGLDPFPDLTREALDGNKRARSVRIEAIREQTKGAHAYKDWVILRDLFKCCVRCGRSLIGEIGNLHRDHIVPLAAGGCDCIANIQPLCPDCNHQGKYEDGVAYDFRAGCMPNWAIAYELRMLELRREPFMGFDPRPDCLKGLVPPPDGIKAAP
jgi:hypothetical protein